MEAARLQIDNFASHSSRFPFTSQISPHYVFLKPVALSSTWQLIRLNIFSILFLPIELWCWCQSIVNLFRHRVDVLNLIVWNRIQSESKRKRKVGNMICLNSNLQSSIHLWAIGGAAKRKRRLRTSERLSGLLKYEVTTNSAKCRSINRPCSLLQFARRVSVGAHPWKPYYPK